MITRDTLPDARAFAPRARGIACLLISLLALGGQPMEIFADEIPASKSSLFQYLTAQPSPRMVTYTPSELDPRQPTNSSRLATKSIRADLEALRPAFDGLVLYGYHESSTPRILAVAQSLKYRAVLLGIWDIRSSAEIDGVVELARLHQQHLAMGVLVGNEGITFGRYEAEDLGIAAARLRARLPAGIPLGTSEPLVGYQQSVVREFGDFLAPNIHPVFDRKELGPREAALWARKQAANLASQTGKPVLLKETGFPHAGQPQYTLQSQRDFWDAYTAPGLFVASSSPTTGWVFHGVAFEAFDLPWKSEESKLEIEKSWGLFDPRREHYPAFDIWQKLSK